MKIEGISFFFPSSGRRNTVFFRFRRRIHIQRGSCAGTPGETSLGVSSAPPSTGGGGFGSLRSPDFRGKRLVLCHEKKLPNHSPKNRPSHDTDREALWYFIVVEKHPSYCNNVTRTFARTSRPIFSKTERRVQTNAKRCIYTTS